MSTQSRVELISNQEKGEMVLDFVRSAKRSTYTMVGGKPSTFFTDLDDYFFGRIDEDLFEGISAKRRREYFAKQVAGEIIKGAARYSISRLAFVEKLGAGPVGMLTLMNLVLESTGLEGCIIRPRKRLLSASLKGRPIQFAERLMIVSDVATTGSTIVLVARRLRQLGAIVPAAYVYYDRGEGAKEALQKEGIDLIAHIDLQTQANAEAELDVNITG